ncbi:MAG TPA: adenylate/guanylate cyclase domain-containing protein [Nitriliruptorales bacterium]
MQDITGGVDLTPYVPRLTQAGDDGSGPGAGHRPFTGALLFADISGFTALSERLAGLGRVGAEEITTLLQHVFTRLLAVAYENDASLLKFGGDALLLAFTGSEHAPRAAHAADGMRRKLAGLGELATRVGPVRLGMTAGVHSGVFDLFLVGTTHGELLITGPAATELVAVEEAAGPGEVVISAEVASHLDPGVVGSSRGGAFLLTRAPRPVPTPVDGFGSGGTGDVSHLVPTAIRRYLQAGGHGSEHRRAAVAFVSFTGTDAYLERVGPHACADALDALVSHATEACDAYDVTFLGSDIAGDGGKLILVAGAPVGHDDDNERLLRVCRAIVTLTSPFELRIGVNSGSLFAGIVGPAYRLTYTVMGDTVNLAARLASAAAPGEILATASTLERTPSRFSVREVPAFHVKGKAEPIDAVAVGDPRGQGIERSHRLPFIGREEELSQLERQLGATDDGGRAVEIVGPPGIGKSRLLSELRDRHPERRLWYGSCSSYESGTPYYAFSGLLRFLLGLADDAGPDDLHARLTAIAPDLLPWASLIGTVVDIELSPGPDVAILDPEFRPHRLREVVGQLLTHVLPEASILRIEDVHWIDDASRALVEHLARVVLPATRWLLVLTSREAAFADVVDETLTLHPLDDDDVERFAHTAAASGHAGLEMAGEIARRAGGNPLYLQELLAFAHDTDELPDAVERTIAARIDQLAPSRRDLLRQAAVLGDRFDLSLLRSVTGAAVGDDDLDALEAFVRRDASGRYAFDHDLYREAAYAGLPFALRRELHDRAARVIETRHLGRTDDVAELLALHYHRADRHEKAWEYNRTAAKRARDRYALGDAVRFLRWALASGARTADVETDVVVDVCVQLGDLLERLGNYHAADDAYRRARRLAHDDRLPELWYRSGIVRERQGRYTQALRWYGRAHRSLDDRPSADRGLWLRVRLRAIEVRIRQGRETQARRAVQRLLPEIERHGDAELTARAHFVAGWAYRYGTEADVHRLRALVLYEQLGDVDGQGLIQTELGISAYYGGRWTSAVDHYTRAAELHERVGDTVSSAVARSNIGEILSDQGRFDEAEKALQRASSVFDAAGYAIASGFALVNLGRLATRRGRHDHAEGLLRDALTSFERIDAHEYQVETQLRVAELAVFRGEPEHALEVLTSVTSEVSAGSPADSFAQRLIGVARSLLGDVDGARAALDAARRAADASRATYERALADVALGWALDEPAQRELGASTLTQLGVVVAPMDLVIGRATSS